MNKRVLLFLAQGFEEYEASVFTDIIGWSRIFGKEPVDLKMPVSIETPMMKDF